MATTTALRWAACSLEHGDVGSHRHVVAVGSPDTMCGALMTSPTVWKSNGKKPKCSACSSWLRRHPETNLS